MKNKNNLISIEICRAIAALGVFSFHQSIGSLLSAYTGLKIFSFFDYFGAYLAVPFFFLISGYCIHFSYLNYIKSDTKFSLFAYYKRRFFRIYPPYISALIITVILNRAGNFRQFPSFLNSLVHLFCLQGFTWKYFLGINLVLWTISVEIAFYLIYPVFFYVRKKYSLNAAMCFSFIISAITISFFILTKNFAAPQFYCFSNIWFSWCCGAFLADKLYFNSKSLNNWQSLVTYLVIFIAFLAFTSLHAFYISAIGLIGYQLKILIWTGPLIFLISKEQWLQKQNSVIINTIRAIGISSYSLYLLHEPLIIFKNFVVNAYLSPKIRIVGFIIGIIMIPALTWLHYYYIEKPFLTKNKSTEGE